MKIIRNKQSVLATVSTKELDEEFDKDIDISEEDFNDQKPESAVETKFSDCLDNAESFVRKAIDSLVDTNNASKRISEEAEKSIQEIVKDLAVILADIQLAKSEIGPIV